MRLLLNIDSASDHSPSHRAPEPAPIGAILAAHWIAHRSGPSPDGPCVFEAARLGLIESRGGWVLTERGEAALRQHGWL